MDAENERMNVVALTGSTDTDELLLRLIGDKDQAAMSLFYKSKSRFVYSLVLNILKSAADAEEVAADVFVKIWQNAGEFKRDRGSVMAWLTTIARRQAIDRTRSKDFKGKKRETSLENLADGTASFDGDDIIDQIQGKEIKAALEKLSDSHRTLIHLSYYEGMSHSMIADRLNTPLGTVKTRIREAVTQLRGMLNE